MVRLTAGVTPSRSGRADLPSLSFASSKSTLAEFLGRQPLSQKRQYIVARSEATENILVGQVGRPHGLRGEVRVEVMSDIPDRFDPGSELLLVRRDGRTEQVRVRSFRPAKGGGLLAFDGYLDRDQVEVLRGARLEVHPSQVPPAPEGLYYYWQLMGCRCVDEVTGKLGEVVDVVEDGGGVLLKVQSGDQTLLIPFVDAFLREVDIEGRVIHLHLPQGLVETCVSKF